MLRRSEMWLFSTSFCTMFLRRNLPRHICQGRTLHPIVEKTQQKHNQTPPAKATKKINKTLKLVVCYQKV